MVTKVEAAQVLAYIESLLVIIQVAQVLVYIEVEVPLQDQFGPKIQIV